MLDLIYFATVVPSLCCTPLVLLLITVFVLSSIWLLRQLLVGSGLLCWIMFETGFAGVRVVLCVYWFVVLLVGLGVGFRCWWFGMVCSVALMLT